MRRRCLHLHRAGVPGSWASAPVLLTWKDLDFLSKIVRLGKTVSAPIAS